MSSFEKTAFLLAKVLSERKISQIFERFDLESKYHHYVIKQSNIDQMQRELNDLVPGYTGYVLFNHSSESTEEWISGYSEFSKTIEDELIQLSYIRLINCVVNQNEEKYEI